MFLYIRFTSSFPWHWPYCAPTKSSSILATQQLFNNCSPVLFNNCSILFVSFVLTTGSLLWTSFFFCLCLSAACVQSCCSSDAVDVVHHSHVVCVQSRNSYSSDPIVHAVHVADRLDKLRLGDHRVSRRRHCMGAHHPSIGRSMLDHLLLLLLW